MNITTSASKIKFVQFAAILNIVALLCKFAEWGILMKQFRFDETVYIGTLECVVNEDNNIVDRC